MPRAADIKRQAAEQSAQKRRPNHNKGFQKGRAKTGGRQARADVWQLLERAAEIATERARQRGRDATTVDTAEELVASLVDTVRRWEPEKALRIMAPLIYPKARFKALDVEVDLDDITGTLKRIGEMMAHGGDIASLEALRNTVTAIAEQQARQLEIQALEKELAND